MSKIVVRNPEEFRAMPEEYKELVLHQLRAHTEGELTGADDYLQLFLPLAPNVYERKICCERAAEEFDHYLRGARVLDDIGFDSSFMVQQHFQDRQYYRTEGVRKIQTWLERGLFSFIGEAAVLAMIEEMAQSSYLPIAQMCVPVIMDEFGHVAHGYRIVRENCQTEEGRAQVQATLDKLWPMTLDLFGRSDSERSKLYVKWGLRQYTNEQARQRYIQETVPKVEGLGLKVNDNMQSRKYA